MFVLGNLIGALADIINVVLTIYVFCLIAAVVISWMAPRSRHPAISFIRGLTEPVLRWIRGVLPFVTHGGFDFSPIVAFLAIMFLQQFLVPTLREAAVRLR